MKRFDKWLVPLTAGLIAFVTLRSADATVRANHFCLLCGERGLADAFLNMLLFTPFGVALSYRRRSLLYVILLGLSFSTAIEVTQLVVPGRDTAAGDVVFNTLGAVVGWLFLQSRALWLRPTKQQARMVSACALALALLLVWLGALLVKPDYPMRDYYGQWTPDFAKAELYQGRVLAASSGNIRIRSDRVARSSELRSQLLSGVPLSVTVIAGPAPAAAAPIFNIFDDRQREVFSIAATGQDVLFHYRSRASALRLDQKTFRLRQALGHTAPGDTIQFELRRVPVGFCLRAADTNACPLGFSAAQLWQVLLGSEMPWSGLQHLFDWLWLLVLFLPAGFWLTGRAHSVVVAAALVAGLFAVSHWGPLLMPSAANVVAAMSGLALGWWLGARQRANQRPHAAIDARITSLEHRSRL